MKMSKRESSACTEDTQTHKTSDILDMKKEVQGLGGSEVGDLIKVEEPAVSTLPTEDESLGSANHIHVQLFDGQVIQITSANLEETVGERKECAANIKQNENPVMTRDLGSGEGTVTLLTSNGKTYLLPQPLGSAEEGRYLIPNEVLSTEEVLHSDDMPQDEQILTISPPPPQSQSGLHFPTSVASRLDALAIATSEVFSEDYETVPLQTHPLAKQPNTCNSNTSNPRGTLETNDKNCTHAREDYPRSSVLPDTRINAITVSDSRNSEERVEQISCSKVKGTLKNGSLSVIPNDKEIADYSVPKCNIREVKNCSEVGQIQLDSTSLSPTCSRGGGVQDNMSKKLNVATTAPKVSGIKERAQETKMFDVISTKPVTGEGEKEKRNVQMIESESVQDGSLRFEVQDKTNLRRSSRIRKVKKTPNKVGLGVANT